jgi:chromosome segregation ATPase
MTSKAINYTPEYSTAQKTRIANTFLEFYKDGKYMFKPDEKRQNQGYYNHKSEIVSNLDKWCATQSAFVKYIIPIIDYNLETDLDAIEDEWVKNHKLRCEIDDLKRKVKHHEDHIDNLAHKRAEELKKEWVSEVEDVVRLQNALDESEQKRIAELRKWRQRAVRSSDTEDRMRDTIERLEKELRDHRTKQIEEELNRKECKKNRDTELETAINDLEKVKKETEKKIINLEKENQSLVKKDIKNETSLLKGEKIKLEYDMLKIKFKESDTQLKLLKSENATLRQMVQVPVQAPLEGQESLHLIRSV